MYLVVCLPCLLRSRAPSGLPTILPWLFHMLGHGFDDAGVPTCHPAGLLLRLLLRWILEIGHDHGFVLDSLLLEVGERIICVHRPAGPSLQERLLREA